MKKRRAFVFIILLLFVYLQKQNTEMLVKQPESTVSVKAYCYRIEAATVTTGLPTIDSKLTPTPVAAMTKAKDALTSKTVALKTIQDYRNACPEGYTVRELDFLAKLIWGEGRGESSKCQVAIGQVVLNRSRLWHGTIEAVIFSAGQFTVAHPKTTFMRIQPTIKEYRNAYEVLSGEKVVPDTALYFHFTGIGKRAWSKVHKYLVTIDKTSFYAK